MKLDFNIQVNQRQGLTLTAQVQQAIKLLHMTNQEIAEFVNDQFQDNPFVETTNFSEANSIQSNTLGNKLGSWIIHLKTAHITKAKTPRKWLLIISSKQVTLIFRNQPFLKLIAISMLWGQLLQNLNHFMFTV